MPFITLLAKVIYYEPISDTLTNFPTYHLETSKKLQLNNIEKHLFKHQIIILFTIIEILYKIFFLDIAKKEKFIITLT